jgi:serpin B
MMNLLRQIVATIVCTLLISANLAASCGQNESTSPVESVNAFTLDLFRQLTKQNQGNLLFSPYSVASSLAMTYVGAKEGTRTQMATALHFPQCPTSEKQFHGEFFKLNTSLNSKGTSDRYQLTIANALWGSQQWQVNRDFNVTLQEYYKASLESVPFQADPEKARQGINQWVEKNTTQKIKELLPKGSISAGTQLVLTNALYFKGSWSTPFKKENTKPLPFIAPTGSVNVEMMNRVDTFNYFADATLQAIEIPYVQQSGLSMVILLPKAELGLSAIKLEDWLPQQKAAFSPQVVDVLLPKFKVESAFDLKNPLQVLGMKDAFSENAKFSGITDQQISLSAVVHKTFVETNEQGTEAAAATAVISVKGILTPSATFRADHPFIFLIKEKNSGVILFIGQVVKP